MTVLRQHKGLVGAKVFYKWLHVGKIAFLVFGSVTQIPEGSFSFNTHFISRRHKGADPLFI